MSPLKVSRAAWVATGVLAVLLAGCSGVGLRVEGSATAAAHDERALGVTASLYVAHVGGTAGSVVVDFTLASGRGRPRSVFVWLADYTEPGAERTRPRGKAIESGEGSVLPGAKATITAEVPVGALGGSLDLQVNTSDLQGRYRFTWSDVR